jgi:hypothetical protein
VQPYTSSAQMAYDALRRVKTSGIPTGLFHLMEHSVIERLAGAAPGTYKKAPYAVYGRMLESVGVNMVDQMLFENPLSMGDRGYEGGGGGATTGGVAVLDGLIIDSPEACADHIERVGIPALRDSIAHFDELQTIQDVMTSESQSQRILGPGILKAGYGHLTFPHLEYYRYGYGDYFMAYAMFPDVFDRLFSLQADYAVLKNTAVVKAFQQAGLPLYHRLDSDMADSRGLLVSLASLERRWVPEFARSIKPAVDAGFILLWHCDGNLMELIPCLLEAGVNGFQGFQYEDGMDYVRICRMRDRLGRTMVIQAGVSVTRELPLGSPSGVREQLRFLVENGPETGLFLSTSSSCTPGTPWENIAAAVEGMKYYRAHGRRSA